MVQPRSTTDDRRTGPLIQAYGEDGILREYVAQGVIILNPDGSIPAAGAFSVTLAGPLGAKAPTSSVSTVGSGFEYETVAASATAQVLGGAGAAGDYLSHIVIIPATTSPGNVLLLDNATSITIFTGGAGSVSSLVPITVPLSAFSVSGAWKLTTGANVSAIAFGDFT